MGVLKKLVRGDEKPKDPQLKQFNDDLDIARDVLVRVRLMEARLELIRRKL